MNQKIEPFFDEYFFELLDEKLVDDILMSDPEERIEKISIIYPWRDYVSNLKTLYSNNSKINDLFIKFQEYIDEINL